MTSFIAPKLRVETKPAASAISAAQTGNTNGRVVSTAVSTPSQEAAKRVSVTAAAAKFEAEASQSKDLKHITVEDFTKVVKAKELLTEQLDDKEKQIRELTKKVEELSKQLQDPTKIEMAGMKPQTMKGSVMPHGWWPSISHMQMTLNELQPKIDALNTLREKSDGLRGDSKITYESIRTFGTTTIEERFAKHVKVLNELNIEEVWQNAKEAIQTLRKMIDAAKHPEISETLQQAFSAENRISMEDIRKNHLEYMAHLNGSDTLKIKGLNPTLKELMSIYDRAAEILENSVWYLNYVQDTLIPQPNVLTNLITNYMPSFSKPVENAAEKDVKTRVVFNLPFQTGKRSKDLPPPSPANSSPTPPSRSTSPGPNSSPSTPQGTPLPVRKTLSAPASPN